MNSKTSNLPSSSQSPSVTEEPSISSWMMLLMGAACGLGAANLYFAQPLVALIGESLHMSPDLAALIVTLTQIGYGLGLLLLVPLGDLIENRKLVIMLIVLQIAALAATAFISHSITFVLVMAVIGLTCVWVQMLVPFAAHLAPAAMRGRVVGNVMSGLMLGIMLARPVSSLITDVLGWHAVFIISAGVMALVAIALRMKLPRRTPAPGLHYVALLASMAAIVRDQPVLRQRALWHSFFFAAFSMFWTVVPMVLAGPRFGLSQTGIALFALAGVAGAIAAPFAGRWADHGHSHRATWMSMCSMGLAFLITLIDPSGSRFALVLFVAAGILLDFGVSSHMVLGQRAIFSLGDALRSRLNGLYMATFFMGGAFGSAVGGWTYVHGGWIATVGVGVALSVGALLSFQLSASRATVATSTS